MNIDQIIAILRVLFAAGGPVAGLLMRFAGLDEDATNNILSIALIVLPPLISMIWGAVAESDHSKIAAAAKVDGVQSITVSKYASGAAAVAAASSDLPTVKKAS